MHILLLVYVVTARKIVFIFMFLTILENQRHIYCCSGFCTQESIKSLQEITQEYLERLRKGEPKIMKMMVHRMLLHEHHCLTHAAAESNLF